MKRVTMINTIMMAVFLIWSLVKPHATGDNIATAGNVATNLTIRGSNDEVVQKAKRRGYFTAAEYAQCQGVNLETVYRRLDTGSIQGAEKVNHRWRIPCH